MPYYSKARKRVRRQPVRRTVKRRKLQSMNKMTRRAVNLVSAAVPAVKTAANLYNIARSARRPGNRKVYKDTQGGGYNQWSQQYSQATIGKLTNRKLKSMTTDTVVYVHQNISNFNDNGTRWLYNGTDAAGNLYYPLVLFELNSCINYINGSLNYACPVHSMTQPAGTTNIGWNTYYSQEPDGTSVNGAWKTEKSSHLQTGSGGQPHNNAIHKWSSLDLELWGQKQKPTKFHICLCQFSEDVAPVMQNSAAPLWTYGNITDPNAVEFWQSLIKQYSYNPLSKTLNGFSKKKFKIIKQAVINIDPTSSTENDVDPHVHTMKLFYKFNRKSNFQWKFANAAGFSISNMNDADYQQEDGENQVQVHPNAKMFIMVRATNYVRNGNIGVTTNDTTPSISWRLRTAYMLNQ